MINIARLSSDSMICRACENTNNLTSISMPLHQKLVTRFLACANVSVSVVYIHIAQNFKYTKTKN